MLKPVWCAAVLFAFAGEGLAQQPTEKPTLPPTQVAVLPVAWAADQPVSVSAIDGRTIAITQGQTYLLQEQKDPEAQDQRSWTWEPAGPAGFTETPLALTVAKDSAIALLPAPPDSQQTPVARLTLDDAGGKVAKADLPALPAALNTAAATVIDEVLYVTSGQQHWSLALGEDGAAWEQLDAPAAAVQRPALVAQAEGLYLFGADASQAPVAYRLDTKAKPKTWTQVAAPPAWPGQPQAVPYGYAHIYVFDRAGGQSAVNVSGYHSITDRWFAFGGLDAPLSGAISVAPLDKQAVLVAPGGAVLFEVEVKTNYGWWDHGVVAAYLLGMLAMGWYFTRKRETANDYFRGGQRIPWWAAGMSLFATGASAISLAGMPGIAFGTDWTYFTVTLASAVFIPIAIFFIAPLVRRMNLSTANAYLERRFGVTSRLFASTIWIVSQVAARIASVMLLSAIALSAIADLEVWHAIVLMGVVTTLYTYLGGLTAVIWTDTIQGFVMVITVVGCLALALFSLDTGAAELWRDLQANDKLKTFDLDMTSVSTETTLVFFLHFFFFTCMWITDQNFVQRVQSTPDLRQTKMAVATQMAVAVPINILLFGLGTMLWLFYRAQPETISPAMKNSEAAFPFFAAQQLPTGLSGLVVAALLAATMSTVSSGICSVSDLCTNDFYKRFAKKPTDEQVLRLGRLLTAAVGVFGTIAALLMSRLDGLESVWKVMLEAFSLISSSILGLFLLGLISKQTHELGAMIGAVFGMLVVVYLKLEFESEVHFLLYIPIGTTAAVPVGLIASLVLPGRPRATAGLTFYDMPKDPPADAVPGETPVVDTPNAT
ncbi:MAG: sodium/solute symporter [Planctomycetota bacterium]